jgi:hypothetical protein
MNKRNYVRYGSELLPGSLSKVTLAWEGNSLIGSYAVNYGPHGISIVIPPLLNSPRMPKEKETVRVLMPIDEKWFTGTCIYVKNEADGSISMGIFFCLPEEQSYLKDLLFHSLNTPRDAHSFVSYEWEEFVSKLCDSDDPKLKKIGRHHMEVMKARQDRPQLA